MSPLILAALAIVVFLTSVLSGIFGMAGGMILLAVLLTMMPVATAIAVHGLVQIVANGSRAIFSRAFIDWRILGVTVLGLLTAAAVLVILRYSPDLVVVTIVVGLLPILVWLRKSWLALDASKPSHAYLSGLVSGGLNLAVGAAGPTIDLFYIRTNMDRRKVIATKAAVQVVSHGAKVIFYGLTASALSLGDLWVIVIAAPFAVFGTNVGYRILQRLTDDGFRKWTRYIVTSIGLVYLVRGLMMLWA